MDARQHSPAAERNRGPICDVLRRVLPPGLLLEVASGTGMHGAWCAPRLPHVTWQPTDADDAARASIAAWREAVDAPNLLPPLRLDVTGPWPVAAASAVLCCNMIHISPWACTEALLAGAARVLPPGGPLVLYGPMIRDGVVTAPSNLDFDASLRARDPRWGLRRLDDVLHAAAAHGLTFDELIEMPANNVMVVLRRGEAGPAAGELTG